MSDFKTVAFIGRKGSGKDTAAKKLEEIGFEPVKFAGALKEMIRTYLRYCGADDETIERMIEGDLKEEPSEYFCGKSTRYAMQTLGTEWGRERIDPNLWLNAFDYRADQFDKVVVADCRFMNESEKINAKDGLLIKVDADSRLGISKDEHVSEVEMNEIIPHFTINNDGTEEEFLSIVGSMAQTLNLNSNP